MKSWEVIREVTENQKRWAYSVGCGDQIWSEPQDQSVDQLMYRIFTKYHVAIIDDSHPDINWEKFNWDFFDQYGGLPALSASGAPTVISKRSLILHIDSPTLRTTPFFYWPGGEQPVPNNVEVEVIVWIDHKRTMTEVASAIDWNDEELLAFRLTGNII